MCVNRIIIVLCLLVLLLSVGCAEMQRGVDSLNEAGPGKPYSWLTDEEKEAQLRRPKTTVDSDSEYWQTEREIEKLRRLNEELRREAYLRSKARKLR